MISLTDTSPLDAILRDPYSTPVPNELREDAPIAIVGEAPGPNETRVGKPFVGASGTTLFNLLGRHNITRSDCSLLNVVQYQPLSGRFDSMPWDSHAVQSGLATLRADMATIHPNLVICLGNAALHVFKEGLTAPPRRGSVYKWPNAITDWRGSLFWSVPFEVKCIAAIHPAAVFRQYTWMPLLYHDLKRAAHEAHTKELTFTARYFDLDADFATLTRKLLTLQKDKPKISVDIEGGVGTIKCISFATSATDAFIVPFTHDDGTSYWSVAEEAELWVECCRVLSDPAIPKVLQNYLYDAFVLGWSYRCPIRGLVDDTMLKHWELLPELEKNLGLQTSLYTTQAYYKDQRNSVGQKLWHYCCMDSAVTYEISSVQEGMLNHNPDAAWHYGFNRALLAPLLYMQHRGILIDTPTWTTLKSDTAVRLHSLQHTVNEATSCSLPSNASMALPLVASHVCTKKSVILSPEDIIGAHKAPYRDSVFRIVELLNNSILTDAQRGELSILCDHGFNVDSKTQMQSLLYQKLALPVQYAKDHGRKTERPTTDALALLTLYRSTQNPLVKQLLQLRGLKDRQEQLDFRVDHDGRIRCSYNLVGTETGRIACYTSNTGSGFNLQTVTSSFRKMFVADPGHHLFQVDLSGADGWTVAAQCSALGDSTMLDDYLAKLKPAKIIAVLHLVGEAALQWPRTRLADACAQVDQKDWLYFACKRVQHATNYGVGPQTMSEQILEDSYKKSGEPTHVSPDVCKRLQDLYFVRYPGVRRFYDWAARELRTHGKLKSASGHTRIFGGRRGELTTVKEFLADGPQENTTYATNLALLRLWTDPTNRRANGSLIVEPLHQMHDALIGQFPYDCVGYAVGAIREWFNNRLIIAEHKITIPFEGGYGPSWGELTTPI